MDIRTKGRLAALALLLTAFVATNAAPSVGPAEAASGDPVVMFSETDARMNTAQATARRHLSRFLDHVLDGDGIARADAAIKVAVPADGGGDEIIWVTPFARRDGLFAGALANEPQSMEGQHIGDIITFSAEQVRDWSFFGPDGRMYGSYTTRVILTELAPERAAQIQEMLSVNPVPTDW